MTCPKCGGPTYWRNGVGFDDMRRCPTCNLSFVPDESTIDRMTPRDPDREYARRVAVRIVNDVDSDVEDAIERAILRAMRRARRAERERCAQLALDHREQGNGWRNEACIDIAAALAREALSPAPSSKRRE